VALSFQADEPGAQPHAGSHALSITEVTVLGYTVGPMPRRPRIVGVEPANDGYGEGLSEPVARGHEEAWLRVLEHVQAAEEA
jgi:hypothetical protein